MRHIEDPTFAFLICFSTKQVFRLSTRVCKEGKMERERKRTVTGNCSSILLILALFRFFFHCYLFFDARDSDPDDDSVRGLISIHDSMLGNALGFFDSLKFFICWNLQFKWALEIASSTLPIFFITSQFRNMAVKNRGTINWFHAYFRLNWTPELTRGPKSRSIIYVQEIGLIHCMRQGHFPTW